MILLKFVFRYKDKLLIVYKDKLLLVNIKNIFYFYVIGKNMYVCLKDGNCYLYFKILE